jgi:uncharacterized protein (TIGR02118 family)
VYKFITMLKKRPDLPFEAFRDHYEQVHAPLALGMLPRVRRYRRKYVVADPGRRPDQMNRDVDVITEVWFDSRADFDATMAELKGSSDLARLAADEPNLFDTSKTCYFSVVEEGESEIGRDP